MAGNVKGHPRLVTFLTMTRKSARPRDLRRRLERLDRRKPSRKGPDDGKRRAELSSTGGLPPGDQLETSHGVAFRIENRYGLDHVHGSAALEQLLGFQSELAAEVAGDRALQPADPANWVFVDLETTGLVGGAGTLGFLIGVGAYVEGGFRLRQYFLRDPAEEPAMLEALREDLSRAAGVVSFNGRAFDLPLLEARYTVALRDRWRLTNLPHFDLLYPSRRLWSTTLADCRLSTLERQVLGVERSDQDVPGALIPELYLEYLRTGEAGEMSRVIYHNAIDILSLVGLAHQVLDRHTARRPEALSAGEALALARWHQLAGRGQQAEAAFQTALANRGDSGLGTEILRWYAAYLKRHDRRAEAVAHWDQWHALDPDDLTPCIELAMYYEWHAKRLDQALDWANRARDAVLEWPEGWRREQALVEVEHRIARLERKLGD